MKKKQKDLTILDLARILIRCHYAGYKITPGYTCADKDAYGDVYVAVQMHMPAKVVELNPPRRSWAFWKWRTA